VAATGVLAATLVLVHGAAASVGAPTVTSQLPRGSDPVNLDPADFSADIDNLRWP
jgi:hypothetical protein